MPEESASTRNNYLSLGKGTVLVVGAILGLGLLGWAAGWWSFDLDRAAVEAWVARAGPWGPLAIVARAVCATNPAAVIVNDAGDAVFARALDLLLASR